MRISWAIEQLVEELEEVKEGDLQQLEQALLQSVMELGRKGMETILAQKAREDQHLESREDGNSHRLRLVGYRERQTVTLLGRLTITRGYYHCEESKSQNKQDQPRSRCPGIAPFDQHWGLTRSQASPGVQRVLAKLAARLTYEEVAETVEDLLPLRISARQVGEVIQPIGEAFLNQEDQHVVRIIEQGGEKHLSEEQRQEEQGPSIRRLYVELDGVLARLRRGSVPMEAQESEREGDVYREVKVGAAFVGEPGPERSELVPGVLVDIPGPKRYVARRTTAEDFGPRLYTLARQAGLLRAQQVVILGDGAKWIWKLAEEQFPGAVQIVDEYHAREHVWDVARAAFAAEPERRDAWAHQVVDWLCQGRVPEVIAAIEKLPALSPPPGKTKSIQQTEAEYFRTNQQRMQYPLFRAQGMHLGSGIAEAACKTVVSTRAKRSGMRWTPEGLASILAIRTALLSQQFEQRWLVYGKRA
ncbi:MAG TPA: ISKra4 family transposase [Ktedonobacteraceae bacterium]|nr:ISKra4 family transposase [Ktedonobacteraceae bacterium]